MARQIFQRVSGRQDVRNYTKKTGAAITIGDLVALDDDTYNILPGATDKLVFGLALETKASSNTDSMKIDRIDGNTVIRAKVATGTAAATEVGAFCDIGSASTGITLTESNNDAVVVGFPEVGYQDIMFGANAAYPTPTTVVSD